MYEEKRKTYIAMKSIIHLICYVSHYENVANLREFGQQSRSFSDFADWIHVG